MDMLRLATLAACIMVAACDRSGDGHRQLAMQSGVAGAGTGASTAAAMTSPGGGKGGLAGSDSTQNDRGPHSGGPH